MNAESDTPLSLGSAIEQAANSTPDAGRSAGPDAGRDAGRTAGPPADKPASIAPPAWEMPGWAKRWTEPARKSLEQLYQREDARPLLDPIQGELEKFYQEFGRQGQEYGTFRKQVEPVWNILSKYEPQYRLQGMTLEQGVGQLVQAAEYLATNPDEALPWLAQTYAPRDAAAVVRALSQAWGVDLGQVTADQPYIDPAVAQLMTPLQQQLQAVQHQLQMREIQDQQRQQQEREQFRHSVVEKVVEFEELKNAAGEPVYPYFRDAFPAMAKALQHGWANDLASAYQFAVRNTPGLMEKAEAERAEAARKKALEEAQARSEEAAKAKAASRNPGTKGRPVPDTRKKRMSLSDAIQAAAGG